MRGFTIIDGGLFTICDEIATGHTITCTMSIKNRLSNHTSNTLKKIGLLSINLDAHSHMKKTGIIFHLFYGR